MDTELDLTAQELLAELLQDEIPARQPGDITLADYVLSVQRAGLGTISTKTAEYRLNARAAQGELIMGWARVNSRRTRVWRRPP